MSPKQTDLGTRVRELEATVRGLTQELVDANERIRHLEEAHSSEEGNTSAGDQSTNVGQDDRDGTAVASEGDGDGGSTKQMGADPKVDEETASDLDDIIVA